MAIAETLAAPPEADNPITPKRRLASLDALRGIAAYYVLIYHYTFHYAAIVPPGHPPGLWISLESGPLGVLLFFMISGFVISLTLEKTERPLDFVVSRFSRLYPTFWACLLITFVVLKCVPLPHLQFSITDLLVNFTMVPGLLLRPPVDGAYWTLQVELIFYVLMFTLYCAKQFRNMQAAVLIGLLVAILNAILTLRGHRLPALVRVLLIVDFLPYFALGIATYRWRYFGIRKLDWAVVCASFTALVLSRSWQDALIALVILVLFAAAVFEWLPFLTAKPLLFLGSISYPLYLLHQYIGFCIMKVGYAHGLGPNANVVVAIASATVLATAVSLIVERPALRWLRASYLNRKHAATAN